MKRDDASMNASSDDASMNPSSIRFVLEALLHGAHMHMSLEVLRKDLKSDERLDESSCLIAMASRRSHFIFPQIVLRSSRMRVVFFL